MMTEEQLHPYGYDPLIEFDTRILVYDSQLNAYDAFPFTIHEPANPFTPITPRVLSRTPGSIGVGFSRPLSFSPVPRAWHWTHRPAPQ